MSEWINVPVRECISTHFAGEWGDEPNPANVQVLRATNVSDEMTVGVEGGAHRKIAAKKLDEKQLLSGDIILEASGGSTDKPVGRVAFFEGDLSAKFVVSNFFRTLRPNRSVVDPKFFCWLLHWLYGQPSIKAMQQQTTGIINLKLEQYLANKIDIPSDTLEQESIANILDTLDTQIRQTEAIIAKLQRVKQGLLHDLLTRGIDANGQLRPPREQAPALYKESPLGWIPREWEVRRVRSFDARVTSGSRDWAQYYANTGDIFVRIGNLTREHINLRLENLQHVNPPKSADGQRTKLCAGDILISITADLGITGVIPKGMGDAYINQHIALIRFHGSEMEPRFAGHFFASEIFQSYLARFNDAGAKAGLNLPTVRNFPLVVPGKDEQISVVTRLDTADMKIEDEKRVLEKLKKQKSGLMDDLLTGRVRVTELLKTA